MSEFIIAQTLDRLNLEFKYEPAIVLAGEELYSDNVEKQIVSMINTIALCIMNAYYEEDN